MKVLRIISLIMSVLMVASFAVGCGNGKSQLVSSLASGEKVEVSEEVLHISAELKPKAEKDGLIPGASVQIKVSGYDELSYYGAVATFTWEYEYLGETPEYVKTKYSKTVELDNTGCGAFKDTIDFTDYRSIKNIEVSIKFSGSAVKK